MAVGFFTHGIEFTLPHPPIHLRTVILICKVVERAWQLLKENPPSGFFLQSERENAITRELVEIIENRLRQNGEVAGFNYALFGRVIRSQEITNFNKEHPDKMPDIFFDLKRDDLKILSNQDGLFVECKPVDHKHPILSCYCKEGLKRFVVGDYAWAMQDALMVGYDKGDYSFGKFASVLDDGRNSAFLKTVSHSAVNEYNIYRSNHKREFEWPENHGQACPITVSHLWLSV